VRSHLISLHDLSIDPSLVYESKKSNQDSVWLADHTWCMMPGYPNIGNRIVIKQNTYIYKCSIISIFAFQPSVLNPHRSFFNFVHGWHENSTEDWNRMEDGALVKEWMPSGNLKSIPVKLWQAAKILHLFWVVVSIELLGCLGWIQNIHCKQKTNPWTWPKFRHKATAVKKINGFLQNST